MTVHLLFDLLGALAAMTATMLVYRWRLAGTVVDPEATLSKAYLAALVAGAAIGAFVVGTLNSQALRFSRDRPLDPRRARRRDCSGRDP